MKIQVSPLLLLHWVRQLFLGIPPFTSDPGSVCLFFILIFYESLAYVLNDGVLVDSLNLDFNIVM